MSKWSLPWGPPLPTLPHLWRAQVLRLLIETQDRLTRIEHRLGPPTREEQLMATVADIQAKVTATKGKVDSLIVLCNEIAQAIRDNRGNPAALDAIAADLDATTTATQTALDANADVDPTP